MKPQIKKFISASALAGLVGVGLFLAGVFRNGTVDYWYLLINLLLGLIPLGSAVWLCLYVGKYGWKNWQVAALGVVWVFFLPNSFYIVTDFIHLPEVARVDMVQDVVMLMQFSVLGLIAGFTSLYMVHLLFKKRYGGRLAMMLIMGVLYLSSFAIYLGRELRWNSWDVVLHPFSVIRDALFLWWSPTSGVNAMWMTISFFAMLTSLYLVLWYGLLAAQRGFSGKN